MGVEHTFNSYYSVSLELAEHHTTISPVVFLSYLQGIDFDLLALSFPYDKWLLHVYLQTKCS